MDIALRPDLQKFVDSKVRSGAFQSAEEVVDNALARWKAEEDIDPEQLKKMVAQAQAEADRGELLDADDVFEEIDRRSQQRNR